MEYHSQGKYKYKAFGEGNGWKRHKQFSIITNNKRNILIDIIPIQNTKSYILIFLSAYPSSILPSNPALPAYAHPKP